MKETKILRKVEFAISKEEIDRIQAFINAHPEMGFTSVEKFILSAIWIQLAQYYKLPEAAAPHL